MKKFMCLALSVGLALSLCNMPVSAAESDVTFTHEGSIFQLSSSDALYESVASSRAVEWKDGSYSETAKIRFTPEDQIILWLNVKINYTYSPIYMDAYVTTESHKITWAKEGADVSKVEIDGNQVTYTIEYRPTIPGVGLGGICSCEVVYSVNSAGTVSGAITWVE